MKPNRYTLILGIFISTSVHVSGKYVPIIRRTYYICATLVFFTVCGCLSGLLVGMSLPPIHFCSHPYAPLAIRKFLFISIRATCHPYISVHIHTRHLLSIHFCSHPYAPLAIHTFLFTSIRATCHPYTSVHIHTRHLPSIHFCSHSYAPLALPRSIILL